MLRFIPKNNSYMLHVLCNNTLFANVENINLHSLYNGKIVKKNSKSRFIKLC